MLLLRKYSTIIMLLGLQVFVPCCKKNGGNTQPPNATKTFINPVINGADPWIFKKDLFYYYTHTLGNRIALWKTSSTSKIGAVPNKEIFVPTPASPNSFNVWAPEIHLLDNKWYVYYTAGAGTDISQRTWVLENSNEDPTTGVWIDKGRIFASDADSGQ